MPLVIHPVALAKLRDIRPFETFLLGDFNFSAPGEGIQYVSGGIHQMAIDGLARLLFPDMLEDFNSGLMVFIPKGSHQEDVNSFWRTPDDVRPITLSNTGAKIIGSALNKAVSDQCELGASEAQNGFVRARLMSDNSLKLEDNMLRYGILQCSAGSVLLDAGAAFPSLLLFWIEFALANMGFPDFFLNSVKALYGKISVDMLLGGLAQSPASADAYSGAGIAGHRLLSGPRRGTPAHHQRPAGGAGRGLGAGEAAGQATAKAAATAEVLACGLLLPGLGEPPKEASGAGAAAEGKRGQPPPPLGQDDRDRVADAPSPLRRQRRAGPDSFTAALKPAEKGDPEAAAGAPPGRRGPPALVVAGRVAAGGADAEALVRGREAWRRLDAAELFVGSPPASPRAAEAGLALPSEPLAPATEAGLALPSEPLAPATEAGLALPSEPLAPATEAADQRQRAWRALDAAQVLVLSAPASPVSRQASVAPLRSAVWDASAALELCRQGRRAAGGRVRLLDPGAHSSVRAAAEALGEGRLHCPEGFCAVLSAERRRWYVLHAAWAPASALAALGFRPAPAQRGGAVAVAPAGGSSGPPSPG
ncbi:unnamed protein product, partial [Prorocentrum cordatum]